MVGFGGLEVVRCVVESVTALPAGPRGELVNQLQFSRFPSAAISELVEKTLVAELDDTADWGAFLYVGATVQYAEIGDLAAFVLASDFPKKYHFKGNPFNAQRRRQRAAFKNKWRVSLGLGQLPVPQGH